MLNDNHSEVTLIKKVYFIFCLVCIFILVFFIARNVSLKNPDTIISITAQDKNVTFRGASIDGEWWGPDVIVDDIASWSKTENNTLTAVNDQSLIISLPTGRNRALYFNSGPNEGIVVVNVNEENFEFNLKSDVAYELGYPYNLPNLDVASRYDITVNTILFIVVLSLFMMFLSFLLKHSCETNSTVYIEKNSSIEMMRFFIIMCVVIHHYNSNITPAGYLGVDFFFLLSGFLLMQHYSSKQSIFENAAIAAFNYTKGRYFRLIPYYLLAFVVCILVNICLGEPMSLSYVFENNIWELLMVDGFGMSNGTMIATGWYCSALIVAGFLVYFLLSKYRETYLYFIAPVCFFVILTWMYQNIGHLNRWTQIDTFTWTGTLRGFAELGLGCVCYKIYSMLKRKKNNPSVNTVIELVCLSYIAYVIFNLGESKADFICVLFMAVLIVSLFMGNSFL